MLGTALFQCLAIPLALGLSVSAVVLPREETTPLVMFRVWECKVCGGPTCRSQKFEQVELENAPTNVCHAVEPPPPKEGEKPMEFRSYSDIEVRKGCNVMIFGDKHCNTKPWISDYKGQECVHHVGGRHGIKAYKVVCDSNK